VTDPLTGRPSRPRVEGTGRLEAFSDGVFAIIVTLLVLELKLPEVEGHSNEAFLAAFGAVAPKFLSFTVSFAIVAIYWVNHHHFFSRVSHTDWKLLWANNLLLFFLAVTPFSTAVLGDHPLDALPIAFYGLNLTLAGWAFTAMGRYVFFHGHLTDASVTPAEMEAESRRSFIGSTSFLAAAALGFIFPPAALAIFVIIPITFVVPALLGGDG
jgi:uncharacterized membrane protein